MSRENCRSVDAFRLISKERRAWAEIDLAALRHNLAQIRGVLPHGCRVMAVVKAEAYGHGAVPVASELMRAGVKDFAVATLEEGIELRRGGIRGDILILGYTPPGEVRRLRRYRLIQTVADLSHAEALDRQGKRVRVHIKLDTGMRRLGEDAGQTENIARICRLKNLRVEGMYTHLCVSDSLKEEDIRFTKEQTEHFFGAAQALRVLGLCPPLLHLQSSYGLLNYPEQDADLVRIGLALYGALGSQPTRMELDLRPVLSFKARIALVKAIKAGETVGYGRQFQAAAPMRIAVVTAGYADGVPRNLSGACVLIRGRRVPVVGRICMDQLTVDVTDIPEAAQGDIATLIGRDGEERIRAGEVAAQAGTIPNELLSRLGSRIGRVYLPTGGHGS